MNSALSNSHHKYIRARIILVLMVFLSYPVITGLDIIDVPLKNTDASHPLVDLTKIISMGGSYLPNDNEYIQEDSEVVKTGTDTEDAKDTAYTEYKSAPRTLKITGRGIQIDSQSVSELKTLKSRLNYFAANDIPIIFDHEYAEVYTYLEVKALIEESGASVVTDGGGGL